MKAIDLFSGAGGFSQGAIMAGCNVVSASTHWQSAVELRAANHPGAQHVCQGLQQADWAAVPAHDLLLASLCFQGHSRHAARPAVTCSTTQAGRPHEPSYRQPCITGRHSL